MRNHKSRWRARKLWREYEFFNPGVPKWYVVACASFPAAPAFHRAGALFFGVSPSNHAWANVRRYYGGKPMACDSQVQPNRTNQ